LPGGARQSIVIDVRGQNVSQRVLDELAQRISMRSGGLIDPDDVVIKKE
jgi:hypothetical protein